MMMWFDFMLLNDDVVPQGPFFSPRGTVAVVNVLLLLLLSPPAPLSPTATPCL